MKFFDFKTWNAKKILKEIALMALMVLVVSNVLSYIRQPDLSSSELPQFKEMMITGEVFDARDFKGKPLLVHFWATWCPVCKAEADNIERLSKYYNVVTIAVKSGDDSAVSQFLAKRDLHYRVINDPDGKWAKTYMIGAYPTSFIYNRNGEISFSEVGYTSTLGLYLRMWWAGL